MEETTKLHSISKVLPLLANSTRDFLVHQYEEEQREFRGNFRMSSLGMCHRSRLWQKNGEEPTNPRSVPNLKRLTSGEWLHNFYYDIWDKATAFGGQVKLKETEKTVWIKEFNLKGHLDAEVEAIVDNEIFTIIVDLKSQDPQVFDYNKREGTTRKPWQEMQVGGYLWAEGLEAGVVWLFEPVYFEEMLTPIILDDQLKQRIRTDMEALMKADEAGTTPPIDYTFSPNQTCIGNNGKIWECKWCDYQDKCFAMNPDHANRVREANKPKPRSKK